MQVQTLFNSITKTQLSADLIPKSDPARIFSIFRGRELAGLGVGSRVTEGWLGFSAGNADGAYKWRLNRADNTKYQKNVLPI